MSKKNMLYSSDNIPITVNELLNNSTAIKILLFDYHEKDEEIKNLKIEYIDYIKKVEYKTIPTVFNIFLSIINILCTAFLAYSINMITNSQNPDFIYQVYLGISIIVILICQFIIILFPYFREKHYNKNKSTLKYF